MRQGDAASPESTIVCDIGKLAKVLEKPRRMEGNLVDQSITNARYRHWNPGPHEKPLVTTEHRI